MATATIVCMRVQMKVHVGWLLTLASVACGGRIDESTPVPSSRPETPSIPSSAPTEPAPPCACTALGVYWGEEGPPPIDESSPGPDSSKLDGCRTYTHRRDFYVARAPLECTTELACARNDPVATVDAALADPYFEAFAEPSSLRVLYQAAMPGDRTLFVFMIGRVSFELRPTCDRCSPAPKPVIALMNALDALDAHALASEPCKGKF